MHTDVRPKTLENNIGREILVTGLSAHTYTAIVITIQEVKLNSAEKNKIRKQQMVDID